MNAAMPPITTARKSTMTLFVRIAGTSFPARLATRWRECLNDSQSYQGSGRGNKLCADSHVATELSVRQSIGLQRRQKRAPFVGHPTADQHDRRDDGDQHDTKQN